MSEVIPQNILNAIQDLPDGLQQQVLEFLQSLDQSAPPDGSRPIGPLPADERLSPRTHIDLVMDSD